MTQVKSYIIGFTLPKLINNTLKYVNPDFTVIYLKMFDQALKIEAHLRDYQEAKWNHFGIIHKLHF